MSPIRGKYSSYVFVTNCWRNMTIPIHPVVSCVSSGQIKHFASPATASKLNYEFRIDFEPRLRDTLKGMVPNLLCQTAGGSFRSVIFFNYLNDCFNSPVLHLH